MKFIQMVLSGILASQFVYAGGIQIQGTLPQTLSIVQPTQRLSGKALGSGLKSIQLLKVSIPQPLKENLMAPAANQTTFALPANETSLASTSSVQLGMNGLPVLDQGPYGTCVTFANSAAIDVIINQGDYISQLCQLQLGNYLEKNGFYPSGWEGSLGPIVLNQMMQFGIINKANERQQGCGGLYSYPHRGQPSAYEMPIDQYHYYSEDVLNKYASWSPILNSQDVNFTEKQGQAVLANVKQAIIKGDRVTFGVLLFNFNQGTVGAVGSYHQANDTWLLTPEFIADLSTNPEFGGHEMIITGFDDKAIAHDDTGRQYKGLLTLRNSWGSSVGDNGNFYMSYEYFKRLTIEAQRITKSQ